MKEKRMPIVAIVLVVVLVGFGVWYGVNHFKGEGSSSNSVNFSIDTFPKNSDDSAVIGRLTDFLEEPTLKTNFKDLEFSKNGNKLVFNCESFSNSICSKIKVNINDKFIYSTEALDEMFSVYGYFNHYKFFKVNNYYVVYTDFGRGLDINTLTIYDKSNNVYTSGLVKSFYTKIDNLEDAEISTVPVIVNNVLHFVEQSGDYADNKLKYNTIDLSKSKINVKLITEFAGYYLREK